MAKQMEVPMAEQPSRDVRLTRVEMNLILGAINGNLAVVKRSMAKELMPEVVAVRQRQISELEKLRLKFA